MASSPSIVHNPDGTVVVMIPVASDAAAQAILARIGGTPTGSPMMNTAQPSPASMGAAAAGAPPMSKRGGVAAGKRSKKRLDR